jgi:NAD(P)-dependent dehydrogenase (short-subunit alcohol dehydrogenase family)
MKGKHVLITGGTAGIGKAAALALARQGAQLTLLGRDRARGETAAAGIRQASGNSAVSELACDLCSQDDVRRAADEFRRTHTKLDVLICNAGMFLPTRELTADGQEKTFAGIYLGQFLLTQLLLDRLKAAPEARIICVTCPPGSARVHFDDLALAQGYSTMKAQFHAKGALLMFVHELARRLAGTCVTANSMLPGYMIKTDLLQRMQWPMRLTVKLFGMSAEQGADPEVWLASAPELKDVTGKHFHRRKQTRVKGQVADDAACRRMWDLSLKLTGL